MPRIYSSSNDPRDYCKRCFPDVGSVTYERLNNDGEGPDGRGNCFEYDADHPPYEHEDYTCVACGKRLTAKDNSHA